MPMRQRDCRRRFVYVAVMLSLSTTSARVDAATAAELKAAFVFNFAAFTVWPDDALAPAAPLQLCVIGDPAVAQALERSARERREIEGHRVVVRKMEAGGPVRSCHVLYAGGLVAKRATELLEALKGVAVLTVSDLPAFTQLGGTAHLFVEGERMRFAVNVESAQRFRLRLSSRLLSLAKLVKDDPNAAPH
jgi:hypothetical protein